ncbi:MAG: PEP-CTERM sorting domain-containing protein [Phycisphaerae bacterium]|nr:PEP-CTERM sorting domain-containing protein [Phycisphaerae bacterium]
MRMNGAWFASSWLALASITGGSAVAALEFTPAAGYIAGEVWSGPGAAHFAVESGSYYIYGAEEVAPDQWQNVVRQYDGVGTIEIARSSTYATDAYFPDAITVAGGDVYWAHAQSFTAGGAANLYKSWFDGGTWNTTQVLDESADINVYSLSTDGDNVFGVGLDNNGSNVAFYLDDSENYNVLAELPADASGGSGFDPAGNFFAGAWSVGGDWCDHMYEFSAQQVADRLAGTQATPYAAGDALADYIVPGNASAVMESDGANLFGVEYNATWSGTNPYAFDLADGTATSLGTLSGAATTVSTDMYYRAGDIYFMGKDDWGTGGEAVIYRLVPEPATLFMLASGALLLRRRRRRGN